MLINRFLFYITLILSLLLFSCGQKETKEIKTPEAEENSEFPIRDLDAILEAGELNAVTTYSSTSYFLYRGQPLGYEYELLKRFTKHLGVELNLSICNDINEMYELLSTGEIDLIAHGLTITGTRKDLVQFSEYLYLTHQVLVQKKPDNWEELEASVLESMQIQDAIELIGDTVSVRANSSYIHRLTNLSEEIGGTIHIDTLPGDLSTDAIIEMVANGEIKYTVADNNIANINASYKPSLNTEVPISFSQRQAWAVHKNAKQLESALNTWVKKMKKETVYYVLYNKYFKNEKHFKRRESSDFYSLTNNKISQYDHLIKKYSKDLNWDWRLLASQVYQESRFDPKSESWAGAHGLMQIMPATAKSLGVTNTADPEQSIKGGTKYLNILHSRFDDIPDSIQRIKLSLASYNCGYSHVRDAQHLATLEGRNPNMWDDNVEEMILKLSYRENFTKPGIKYGYVRGIEPYTYVKQIFSRYEHYVRFIE